MLDKVRQIIADITYNDIQSIREDTSAQTVKNWTSSAQIAISIALEEEFQITFEPEELTSLNNVPSIVAAIKKHQREG